MCIINKNDKKNETLINEAIRSKEVRVVSMTGEKIGIFSISEALNMAYEQELDLVCMSPNAEPPVCKIMNYKKFKFENEKKLKLAKKNQNIVQTKEIRLSPTIDKHDFDTKRNAAIKFIQKGDKVKFVVQLRGRMIAHKDLGITMLEKMGEELTEYAVITQKPKLDGRNLFMFLEPIKK